MPYCGLHSLFPLRRATLWAGLWFMVNIWNPKGTLYNCYLHNALFFKQCTLQTEFQVLLQINDQQINERKKKSESQCGKKGNNKTLESLMHHFFVSSLRFDPLRWLAYRTLGVINLQCYQTSSTIHPRPNLKDLQPGVWVEAHQWCCQVVATFYWCFEEFGSQQLKKPNSALQKGWRPATLPNICL